MASKKKRRIPTNMVGAGLKEGTKPSVASRKSPGLGAKFPNMPREKEGQFCKGANGQTPLSGF